MSRKADLVEYQCLMPLCNVPLIEYTLEVLAVADVAEVFVVCTSHIDQIKEYFEQVASIFTMVSVPA